MPPELGDAAAAETPAMPPLPGSDEDSAAATSSEPADDNDAAAEPADAEPAADAETESEPDAEPAVGPTNDDAIPVQPPADNQGGEQPSAADSSGSEESMGNDGQIDPEDAAAPETAAIAEPVANQSDASVDAAGDSSKGDVDPDISGLEDLEN